MRSLKQRISTALLAHKAQLLIEFGVMLAGVFFGSLAGNYFATKQWLHAQNIEKHEARRRCAYRMELARLAVVQNNDHARWRLDNLANGTPFIVNFNNFQCAPLQQLLDSDDVLHLLRPTHLHFLTDYLEWCRVAAAVSADVDRDYGVRNTSLELLAKQRETVIMMRAAGEALDTELQQIVDTSYLEELEFQQRTEDLKTRIRARRMELMQCPTCTK